MLDPAISSDFGKHMKSSFPKRVKRQSMKKRGCNANASTEIMFWKRVLHKYVPIYTWGKLFTKSTILELSIGIVSSFSGIALSEFWKRTLHIYTYIHISKALV